MRFAMYMYGFLGTSRDDMWTNRISESAIFTADVSIRCFKGKLRLKTLYKVLF